MNTHEVPGIHTGCRTGGLRRPSVGAGRRIFRGTSQVLSNDRFARVLRICLDDINVSVERTQFIVQGLYWRRDELEYPCHSGIGPEALRRSLLVLRAVG